MSEIWTPSSDKIGYAWVNNDQNALPEHRYYCHGFGLGTYDHLRRTGYTIDSSSTKAVLADKSLFTTVEKDRKYYISATRNGPGTDADPQYFNIKARDIVAFFAYYYKDHSQVSLLKKDYAPLIRGTYRVVYHTAIIKTPIFKKGTTRGWYLSQDTELESKNGPQPLGSYRLRQLLKVYQETTSCAVYRHVPGAGVGELTPEQRADIVARKATPRGKADTVEAQLHVEQAYAEATEALLEEPLKDPEFPNNEEPTASSSSSGPKQSTK